MIKKCKKTLIGYKCVAGVGIKLLVAYKVKNWTENNTEIQSFLNMFSNTLALKCLVHLLHFAAFLTTKNPI